MPTRPTMWPIIPAAHKPNNDQRETPCRRIGLEGSPMQKIWEILCAYTYVVACPETRMMVGGGSMNVLSMFEGVPWMDQGTRHTYTCGL